MLFTETTTSKLAWSLAIKKLTREQKSELLQNYSLKQLLTNKALEFEGVKELYQKDSKELQVVHIRHTNMSTLKFATSLPQPLIWVAPKEVFNGKLLTSKQKALGAGLLYKLLVPSPLSNIGARVLPANHISESNFLSQKQMRIEIRSQVFHAYHRFFKTPLTTKQDYVEYRKKREFLTKTELMTLESYELLMQYPRVFDQMISRGHFSVNLVQHVMSLPRPYLKLIEEHLETGHNKFVFMNSNSQSIGIGAVSLFLRVLKELTGEPLTFYNVDYNNDKQLVRVFSKHHL